jgi:hypothetical protein
MGRGFFGRRRHDASGDGAPDWPQLPVAAEPSAEVAALDAPALAYVQAIASAAPADPSEPPEGLDESIEGTTAEAALLAHIAACRSAVADALYQSSRDYQVLCDLVHESLPACEEAVAQLRLRLDGNVHYAVLAKLDEAYALAEAGAGTTGADR